MMRIFLCAFIASMVLNISFHPNMLRADSIGEHMQQMEKDKNRKQKELSRLEELEKIIADEIGTAKAEMAQSMSDTVQKIGKTKKSPDGLVTTAGGIVHSPKQHWELDVEGLRKEYKNAGIYTEDEIDTIVEFHEAYIKNKGFTAGIAEQLAKVAEGKAQQRAIQKYISRKKQEIRDLENALQGNSSSNPSSDGGGGGGGY
jgi:predicted  nucleic acid-binding Zn-ribbon protein